MYAIIKVGGKQYKVEQDDIIEIEHQDEQEGKKIDLNEILLISEKDSIQVGQPYVTGAKIEATVLKDLKARKVMSYKYRRRKSSHWRKGHRQLLTQVKITKLSA